MEVKNENKYSSTTNYKKRNSVRAYEEKKLSTQDKEKLMAYADSLTNPFGVKVNFHIIEKDLNSKYS